MDTYSVAFKVIKHVIDNEFNLKDSIRKEIKEATRGETIEVSQISGIFFRNYYLISHLADILNFKFSGYRTSAMYSFRKSHFILFSIYCYCKTLYGRIHSSLCN